MKQRVWTAGGVVAMLWMGLMGPVYAAPTCGDDGPVCREDQRCCEHVVATFCENEQCGYSYVKGRCVSQEQSCEEFWCGNRQCGSSWFGSESVCCVYQSVSASPSYACTPSELNCRGNANRVTIRSLSKKSS